MVGSEGRNMEVVVFGSTGAYRTEFTAKMTRDTLPLVGETVSIRETEDWVYDAVVTSYDGPSKIVLHLSNKADLVSIEPTCTICGKRVYDHTTHIYRGQKFCSHEHAAQWLDKRLKEETRVAKEKL